MKADITCTGIREMFLEKTVVTANGENDDYYVLIFRRSH